MSFLDDIHYLDKCGIKTNKDKKLQIYFSFIRLRVVACITFAHLFYTATVISADLSSVRRKHRLTDDGTFRLACVRTYVRT